MDGCRSISRIADSIAPIRADIVCLQEVHQRLPWSGLADQPAQLGRLLGMKCIFQRAVNIGIGGFGVAVLTQLPIEAVARHALPSLKERRGALAVRMNAREGSITVLCTHWGLDEEERCRQAERVAQIAQSVRGRLVLAGDLNEETSGRAVQQLFEESLLEDPGGSTGVPTYPAPQPTARIDYILTRGIVGCQVTRIQCEGSDHYPVLGEW